MAAIQRDRRDGLTAELMAHAELAHADAEMQHGELRGNHDDALGEQGQLER